MYKTTCTICFSFSKDTCNICFTVVLRTKLMLAETLCTLLIILTMTLNTVYFCTNHRTQIMLYTMYLLLFYHNYINNNIINFCDPLYEEETTYTNIIRNYNVHVHVHV